MLAPDGFGLNQGYYKSNRKGSKNQSLHRLVMEEILGRKLLKSETVHHKDGDKTNNDPDNLEVMSWEEHARLHAKERLAQGNHNFQNNRYAAKLTEQDVKDIRSMSGKSYSEIAAIYGVTDSAIGQIIRRVNWKNV